MKKKNNLIIADHGLGDLVMSLGAILALHKENNSKNLITRIIVKSAFEAKILQNLVNTNDLEILFQRKPGFINRIFFLIKQRKELKKVFLVHSTISLKTFAGAALFFGKSIIFPSKFEFSFFNIKSINTDNIEHKINKYKALCNLSDESFNNEEFLAHRQIPVKIKDAKKTIIFCPGSSHLEKHKRWPAEYFIELSELILDKYKNTKIILMGADSDIDCIELIYDANPKLSKKIQLKAEEMIDTILSSSVVVSGCTGTSHLANFLGIETITIFGPTNYKATGPIGKYANNLKATIYCSPCYSNEFRTGCGNPVCMEEIKPKLVYNFIENLLNK